MRGDGAESALAEAAAVRDYAEADLVEGWDAALRVVVRMPRARVRQRVDLVHLRLRQRTRRAVLHDAPRALVLYQPLAAQRVLLSVVGGESLGEFFLVRADFAERRQRHGVVRERGVVRLPAGSGHVAQRRDRLPRREPLRYLERRQLPHAEYEQVGAAVRKYRTAH